jgi:hypothetical protein
MKLHLIHDWSEWQQSQQALKPSPGFPFLTQVSICFKCKKLRTQQIYFQV